ncbi:CoA-binding protein [Corallococcus sp. RDP092CA]|uniref:CoA-binding protein n=1 Tax=Corallococcus sp. RDP092CA TaxID=3109369 RepID=UPI0035B445E2
MDDWRQNLIDDAEGIGELLARTRRVAVLGIRPEAQADKPAHAIPRFLKDHGFTVLPVPTHGEQGSIPGEPVSASVQDRCMRVEWKKRHPDAR